MLIVQILDERGAAKNRWEEVAGVPSSDVSTDESTPLKFKV